MVQLQILALSISHASTPSHNKTHTSTYPSTKRTPGEPLIPTKCKQRFFSTNTGLQRYTSFVEVDPSGDPCQWELGPNGVRNILILLT